MNPNQDVNPLADEIKNLEAEIAQIDVNQLDPSDNGKLKQVDQEPTQPVETKVETEESTVDPIQAELDRVKGQTQGKTPQEKFEYKLKRELAQAEKMGIDIANLGVNFSKEDTGGEQPITRKDLEEALRNVKPQSKSAVEMAMEIGNEAEKELHLHYLENKVNPNLTEDEKFQTAKDMVNAIKLKNHIKLDTVRPNVQNHSTASSFQPVKQETFDNQRLTREEEMFFEDAKIRGIPFTKEEILKMRK